MGFDVSGLVAHIKEDSLDFSMKSITGSKIFDSGFRVMEGIKPGVTVKVPNIEQTAPFRASNSCAITPSGTTAFGQTNITTTAIEVTPEWCLYDLEQYFTYAGLPAGAKADSWSKMNVVTDRLAAQIARRVGYMLMQGKTTFTNDSALSSLNGILAKIDTAGSAIAGNTGSVTVATGITTSNVLTIFDALIAAIPNAIFTSSMPTVMVGYDTYRTLCTALRNSNAFNFYTTAGDFEGKSGLVYPGTSVRIVPMNDMNNTQTLESGVIPTAHQNRMLALNPERVIIGTDKLGDMTDFDVWYDPNTRKLKMFCRFTLGVALEFIDEIVQFKLA